MNGYAPAPETAALLNAAIGYVRSVEYTVTARWVFYRLLQDGYVSAKSDYKRLLAYLSKARKGFYGGWQPDTLTDDTRAALIRGDGFNNGTDWVQALIRQARCNWNRWGEQANYVELWFEAAAMASQFQFYGDPNLPLLAFHGDVSIPEKWKAAVRLVERWVERERPIHVLYYGDLDTKGLQIPLSAEADVRRFMSFALARTRRHEERPWEWEDIEEEANRLQRNFHWRRVGINQAHVQQYAIPENPERPGTYQWEGLSDDGAQALIAQANDLLDAAAFAQAVAKEQSVTGQFVAHLAQLQVQEP